MALVEPPYYRISGDYISRQRNYMHVAGSFLKSLFNIYGKYIVYYDDGPWSPEACNSLGLKHTLHRKLCSVIERTKTKLKYDCYSCSKNIVVDCNLIHIYQGALFRFLYNLSKS